MDAPVQPLGCTFTYYIYYYIYVMLLGPSRLRPSLCLVSSRLSQTHTDTHHTTDTSPVLLLFFLLPDPFLLEPGR